MQYSSSASICFTGFSVTTPEQTMRVVVAAADAMAAVGPTNVICARTKHNASHAATPNREASTTSVVVSTTTMPVRSHSHTSEK